MWKSLAAMSLRFAETSLPYLLCSTSLCYITQLFKTPDFYMLSRVFINQISYSYIGTIYNLWLILLIFNKPFSPLCQKCKIFFFTCKKKQEARFCKAEARGGRSSLPRPELVLIQYGVKVKLTVYYSEKRRFLSHFFLRLRFQGESGISIFACKGHLKIRLQSL